jgi:predicted ATP-grasp superfamily ATP-dependent carboligase
MSRSVLVTCGEHRAALAIVRSLGRAGFEVTVCSTRVPSLAGASRYAARELALPDPVKSPEDYSEHVARLIDRDRPDLVIPVTEAALLATLSLADRFPDTTFPFPDLTRFTAICDKGRVFDVAREEGISVPDETVLVERGDFDATRIDVPFPVVIKPVRSVSGPATGRVTHGVVHASDATALETALTGLPSEAFPVHVQRRIVGPGTGVFLLRWEGRILATFAHRRIREKPPAGGVSVLCESIVADPDLVEKSRRLLERFDWNGVAMVEFKRDTSSGEAYLMEINGRFWGSLELAVASGVDFPLALAEASMGHPTGAIETYRVGVRSRWVWGDVDHLIMRVRKSDRLLSLPPGVSGRARAILDFITSFASGRSDVFRTSDPGPAFRETLDWFAALGGRGS